ncbi:MAG: gamma-glutamyltransferase [Gemmatimonadetes bacterium]|nr:gamma-glutamyltransferase [Gemmatimonadota bacterium]
MPHRKSSHAAAPCQPHGASRRPAVAGSSLRAATVRLGTRRAARAAAALALAGVWGCAVESGSAPGELAGAPQVASSMEGVVVAAQPLAAAAGAQMLTAGGNAADAAVAAAFAISVVEPSMNSIGGRTQILLRLPDGTYAGIDATTQAPATYDPETAPQASYGYPTVGVPGAVAGLGRLLRDHGTLPLADVMAPAIALAENGYRLLPGEAIRQGMGAEQLAEFDGSRAHFLTPDGNAREAGDLFTQPDLAATFRTIAEGGEDAFYRGPIAQRIVADMEAHGGAVTASALADYRALDVPIVHGSYRGYDLVGTDIPASGAATIGILHILENFDMASLDSDSWAALVGTVVARAFEERALARGSGFGDLAFMTDKGWAADVAAGIDVPGAVFVRAAAAATPALPRSLAPALSTRTLPGSLTPAPREPAPASRLGGPTDPFTPSGATTTDWDGSTWGVASSHTTHLSAADGDGMYVSLTQTIGPNLGSRVATPGLGFLYAATLGGYLGHMEPGERARSSISPLMVARDGQPVLVLGAAGGARIISAVVQAVLRVVDHGMSLPDALAAARVHPIDGGIAMETSPGIGWSSADVAEVASWGLQVQEVERAGAFGRIHGIWVDPGTGELVGVADPDWEGAAIVPGAP